MLKTLMKIVGTILLLTALAKYRFLYILSRTWKRDFRTYLRICKALPIFIKTKINKKGVYHYLDEVAKKHPQKTAYLFEDEAWTFCAVKELSDKISIYFEREGYCKGDSIALLLNNCPDYVCIWLGLSRIGVVAALVNTNLVNDPLIHSLKVAKCKAVIFGENFCESVSSCVKRRLDIKCYQYNRKSQTTPITENCTDLAKSVDSVSPDERLKNHYNITSVDPLLYLYTSGTTGLPKAAILKHSKMILLKSFVAIIASNPENIILYCPLPLHHGSGGILGCGHALLCGSTVVIKTKFSASNYWKDCVKYNCNAAQYIGEMCRYILSSCPEDNIKHQVKVMLGNGLKPNIWKVFQQKYHINQVYEFYACTEGNFSLLNLDNKVGSVGHIPPYLQKSSPLQLVRYSEESSKPIRNVDGFCMIVGENEPGLAIGAIVVNKRFEQLEYTGYVDAHETNKKILHDVFVKGDRYFNSGDVMCRDELGYYYFVDRLGDTFRWKGENVSTNEVEAVISNAIGFKDVMVYGVEIPGTEGRAGMIAIVQDHTSMDMDLLLSSCKKNLPSYAIPIFVRFLKSSSLTSTYKLKKFDLKSEGFNINVVTDTIYICNPAMGKYEVLTPKLYSEINDGTIRL